MQILWVFVIGMLFMLGASLYLFHDTMQWREIAAKNQDEAAKLREKLSSEREYNKHLSRDLTGVKDDLRAEINKCEELRRMLAEARTALDGERESWTELLDREREKNRELYDDLTQERDAYAKLKNEYTKLENEISEEQEKLAREKQILCDMQNVFRYDGTDAGQVDG